LVGCPGLQTGDDQGIAGEIGQRYFSVLHAPGSRTEQHHRTSLERRALKVHTLEEFRAPLPGFSSGSDFKNVKKKIFLGRRRGRHFNPPTPRHNVLPIRAEDFIEILAPKKFPHMLEFWILRKRRSPGWFKRPVLA